MMNNSSPPDSPPKELIQFLSFKEHFYTEKRWTWNEDENIECLVPQCFL